MNSLNGKTIFITGASSGIGKACAEIFAKEKSNLVLTGRRVERIKNISKKLEEEYSIKTKCIKIDVRDFNQIKKAVNSLDSKWNKIDILINNAGLARGFNKIYDGKKLDWDEMIDTNIKGLAYVSRLVLPLMIKRKKGHVINIGSTAGHEVYPNGNVYSATKYAVKALSQSIRIDVLDKGINVSSVDPGMVETEFSLVRFRGDKKKASNVYKGLKPLSPENVAEAVLFCASRPENVNINEIILTPLAQASSTQVHRKR
ncbi:MAG: SDR family NAD(P)-dependent oxidoreductase [Ignavibacteria bacterium]|nr:SDR family NAD(P)-dependent oxidoreductase [Ignavibacteria bacterium]MBT8380808.1 SDR family NAD(P)-dependent oxidoreductase [Ignavibacteria bacterium]MBT8392759.1 SDR family NAD(P)-dependent oxidoreductase [Ignavibacteria bacterium]NNJ54320.1 SDR family NAD(P)-dependent oxidoreductase [Ignavibacteriaceae bacterium]NNL22046.1 SDR family NAD(P)-dependent oxidoreductase [Ignavibacteriaceae bacterium]